MACVLAKFGVKNKCMHFTNKHLILNINTPVIISYENSFVILKSIEDGLCHLSYDKHRSKAISLSQLLNGWNGDAIVIISHSTEENEYARHKYQEWIKKTKLISGVSCILLFLSYPFFINHDNLLILLILFLNIVGIYLCSLLIKKSLGISSKTVSIVCSLIKGGNCSTPVSNRGAFILHRYLPIIGMSFFLGNTVWLSIFSKYAFTNISILTFIILPFTIVSLLYQAINKNWCVLCIGVISLLYLMGVCCYIHIGFPIILNHLGVYNLLLQCSLFILLILILAKLENLFINHKELAYYKRIYNELKYDERIEKVLLPDFIDSVKPSNLPNFLVFGNTESHNEIIIVGNPFCLPCGILHDELSKLKEVYSFRIKYVFTYFDISLSEINKIIIGLYQQKGEEECWSFMSDWFEDKKESKAFYLPTVKITDRVKKEFKLQINWCSKNKVSQTPTIIINGKLLVAPYNIKDLRYLLQNHITS